MANAQAKIQQHCMKYRSQPYEASENVDSLGAKAHSSSNVEIDSDNSKKQKQPVFKTTTTTIKKVLNKTSKKKIIAFT